MKCVMSVVNCLYESTSQELRDIINSSTPKVATLPTKPLRLATFWKCQPDAQLKRDVPVHCRSPTKTVPNDGTTSDLVRCSSAFHALDIAVRFDGALPDHGWLEVVLCFLKVCCSVHDQLRAIMADVHRASKKRFLILLILIQAVIPVLSISSTPCRTTPTMPPICTLSLPPPANLYSTSARPRNHSTLV